MLATISIIISLLVLLVTSGQWHVQRVHNANSVKPLGQIYFWDRDKTIAVRIINNGLGPLIIDRLTFSKNDSTYSSIDECLALDARSYMHALLNDSVQRVILPNSQLTVFETQFEDDEDGINNVRQQLCSIILKVEGRDIYDNKITLERDFQWFSRHTI